MLTAERVRELFEYNPESGKVTNRIDRGRWGSCKKGTEAVFHYGFYMGICIDSKQYLAHRVIWLIVTGKLPKHEIDHINLDKKDNRWLNLREASHSQNGMNKRTQANSSTGLKGVSRADSKSETWRARLTIDRKEYHIGTFKTKEEAFEARMAAARNLQGKFVRAS